MDYELKVSFILVSYKLIIDLLGINGDITANIDVLILLTGIIIGRVLYKRRKNKSLTYFEGIQIGLIITMISSIISRIYMIIYFTFFDDSIVEYVNSQNLEILKNKGASQVKIDAILV